MKTLSGNNIRKMLLCGYGLLDKNKEAVDALNVFPVPDGDTGINMALTLKSVVKELDITTSNDIKTVCECISRGALKGARGNSGVILSQILKGMMDGIAGHVARDAKNASTTITPAVFASAMEKGTQIAYKAVTVPKEGTMLTVIRVMTEESKKIAGKITEFEPFLLKVIGKGEEILAKTPDMLPVLKKAGVVDAGGRGVIIMFAGFLAALNGDDSVSIDFAKDGVLKNEDGGHMAMDSADGIEFAYCTQFVITNMYKTTTTASIESLREKLCRMGDSVACVGDLKLVNAHVHTNSPGEALTLALNLGEVTEVAISNMLEQNRELRAKNKIEEKDQSMIAIAVGDGIVNVFKDLGCDFIIRGGQTMNPSAEDIAEACRRVYAKNIFIFPNNKNIILAAKHASALVDKNIIVIPTKSINEGISACIMFNGEASIEENTEQFLAAIQGVKSGAVTWASKNTTMNRFEIKEGEIIGIDDKSILAKGKTPNEVALKLVEKMMDGDSVNVTLFYGSDVREKDAMLLQDKLNAKYPNCEINLIMGGQPVYYYLVSLE